MNTVQQIIDARGGLDALRDNPVVIQNEPYMALHVEHVGRAFGGVLVSVAHYYRAGGDAVADPDLVLLVKGGHWFPVEYSQPGLGVYQRAMWRAADGRVMVNPKLRADLARFAAQWGRTLRDQGFADRT